jgi:hypothetical protein
MAGVDPKDELFPSFDEFGLLTGEVGVVPDPDPEPPTVIE